jgi:hypothetical protein
MTNAIFTPTSSNQPTGSERWKLRIGSIFWFLALLGLFMSFPVLLEIGWWALLSVVLIGLVLALPITWLVRRLFEGQRRHLWKGSYLKSALGSVAVLAILMAAPLYAAAIYTQIRPSTVPQATLSNGSKTVIFQGMMHIGSEGFYKSVVYDIERALTEGYVMYYEGVTPDPEGDQWFTDTLAGGGDLSSSYEQFGAICGLNFQLEYFGLLQADMAEHPERHVKADVNTGQMKAEYERLVAADPSFADAVAAENAPVAQQNGTPASRMTNFLAQLTSSQLSLVGTACRGFLSWQMSQKSAPSVLDPVILDFRNRELVQRILTGPDKIYITYGAYHLPGVISLLQAADPAWQIGSVKWMRTIDTPENLQGEID